MKGFRSNSPLLRNLIQKRHGKEILKETILQQAQKEIAKYIQEKKLQTLGTIELDPDKEINWEPTTTISLTYPLDIVPPFTIDLNKKQKIESYTITSIDQETIKEETEKLQKIYGTTTEGQTTQPKDIIYGKIKDSQENTRSIRLPLADQLLKEIDLRNKKVSQQISWPAEKAKKIQKEHFPNLIAQGDFLLTIEKIVRYVPAPLDQSLFDKALGKNQVKNLKEFTEKIKHYLLNQNQRKADELLIDSIKTHLLNNVAITIPEKYEKERAIISWDLIMKNLAETHTIKIGTQEIIKEIGQYHQKQLIYMGIPPTEKNITDRIAEDLKDPKQGLFNQIHATLLQQEVLQLIKEKIQIEKQEISAKQLLTKIKESTPSVQQS